MKNLFLTLGVVATLSIGLSSCSKDYTCDYGNGNTIEYTGLSGTEADAAEIACNFAGGEWSKN